LSLVRKAFWPAIIAIATLAVVGALGRGGIVKTAQADISRTDFHYGYSLEEIDDNSDECSDWPELPSSGVLFSDADNGIWICLEEDSGIADTDEIGFDTDGLGKFTEAFCWDDTDFDAASGGTINHLGDGATVCGNVVGLSTADLTIVDSGSDDFDLGLAVFYTCNGEEGNVKLIIDHESEVVSVTMKCAGGPDTGTIKAIPTKVEIVPALGSTQYSLIMATYKDDSTWQINSTAPNDAVPGFSVTWTSDNCPIITVDLSTDIDDPDENAWDSGIPFVDVKDIFDDYNANMTPSNAAAIASFVEVDAGFDPDDFDLNPDGTFAYTLHPSEGSSSTDTISAVLMSCGQGTGATPGVSNVMAIANNDADGTDVILKVAVTVVGPPAGPIAVAADATSVTCGDRVTITVTVKDSKGQNVSDHTLVEAVSTLGGILGGTGAVAGNYGFVVPVSSTLAETFNGVATFFLLTSQTQVGTYDVTISTGGGGAVSDQVLGGLFSTPVQTGHVSVTCTLPVAAPAPTVTAPRTGTAGVTPPNTGDAGLAATNSGSSSWVFFAGVAVLALASVAGLKLVTRR
jgi:hypothetical protein